LFSQPVIASDWKERGNPVALRQSSGLLAMTETRNDNGICHLE